MPDWRITKLAPDQEQAFQRDMMFSPAVRTWRKGFEQSYGETPNLNDPGYDYRGAWKAGVTPQPYDDGSSHWVSGAQRPPFIADQHFKSPDHPTMWMQNFLDRYGVVPEEASGNQIAQGARDGVVPLAPSILSAPEMPPSPTIPDRPEAYDAAAYQRLARALAGL